MQRIKDIALRTLSMFAVLEAIFSLFTNDNAPTAFAAASLSAIAANAV